MDFRRSATIDERRRRVLMEEIAAPAGEASTDEAAVPGGAPKGPVRAYCPAVLEERQPRLTALVPVRPALVTILILLGVTAVAAIETAHIYSRTTPLGAAPALAAFDATERGSVAQCFAALALLLAAVGAVVVFSMRRHRVDDYRGRYRVWLWAAGVLAWCSLDAATGLHDALGLAVAVVAGASLDSETLGGAVQMGWLSLYGLALGALVIRIGVEIWPSLGAFSSLAVASLLYFLGGLAELGILPFDSPLVGTTFATGLVMLAHVAIASSVLLFARHVHLDAQGRLKVHIDPAKRKKAKPKPKAKLKVVKEEGAEPAEKKEAAKPAAPTQPRFGQPTPAQPAAATITRSSSSYEDEEDDEDGDERLSKSERRRLKKLARREQGRRAA